MYERMFGDALHADRLRASLAQLPLVAVERERRAQQRSATRRRAREAVARVLVALATRLAPGSALPTL
jgi:hypothetical protein